MNFRNNFVGGVFWSAIESIVSQGFTVIVQLLLARLLFPEDYGLIGMVSVFVAFINVFSDLGMNAAIVQRKEDQLTPSHFDTVFLVKYFLGCISLPFDGFYWYTSDC